MKYSDVIDLEYIEERIYSMEADAKFAFTASDPGWYPGVEFFNELNAYKEVRDLLVVRDIEKLEKTIFFFEDYIQKVIYFEDVFLPVFKKEDEEKWEELFPDMEELPF